LGEGIDERADAVAISWVMLCCDVNGARRLPAQRRDPAVFVLMKKETGLIFGWINLLGIMNC
jgi:pyruvate kinase